MTKTVVLFFLRLCAIPLYIVARTMDIISSLVPFLFLVILPRLAFFMLVAAIISEIVAMVLAHFDADPLILHEITRGWGATAQIAAIAALGSATFWLKYKAPLAYGWVEIMVGAAVGWVGLHMIGLDFSFENGSKWFTMLGGIYIVVRGLDNIKKYLDERSKTKDTIFRKWFDQFLLPSLRDSDAPYPGKDLLRFIKTGNLNRDR